MVIEIYFLPNFCPDIHWACHHWKFFVPWGRLVMESCSAKYLFLWIVPKRAILNNRMYERAGCLSRELIQITLSGRHLNRKHPKKSIRSEHLSGKPKKGIPSQHLSWMPKEGQTKLGMNGIIESWVDSNQDSLKFFLSHELIWIKILEAFWGVSRFESNFRNPFWVVSWFESSTYCIAIVSHKLSRIKPFWDRVESNEKRVLPMPGGRVFMISKLVFHRCIVYYKRSPFVSKFTKWLCLPNFLIRFCQENIH